MNKFLVFPCVEQNDDDDGYQGPVVSLASSSNVTFVLFFPISEQYAKLINFMLKKEENDADIHLLSIYQTMLDSWKAGDRYLAGIIMDIINDGEEEIISPSLILCDSMGNVDAVLNVSFVHAVILAAMERKEILVTNELLQKLLPMPDDDDDDEDDLEEGEEESSKKDLFPVDKQILDIARNIMSGKKQEPTKGEEGGKDPEDSK